MLELHEAPGAWHHFGAITFGTYRGDPCEGILARGGGGWVCQVCGRTDNLSESSDLGNMQLTGRAYLENTLIWFCAKCATLGCRIIAMLNFFGAAFRG